MPEVNNKSEKLMAAIADERRAGLAAIERLNERYTDLLTRHNALVEAVHKAMGRVAECDKKQTDEQLIADISYLKRLVQDQAKRAEEAEEKHSALHKAVACLIENIRNVDYLWEGTDSEIFPKVLKFGTGKEELLKARRVVEDLL